LGAPATPKVCVGQDRSHLAWDEGKPFRDIVRLQ
jgi:hypothetical protein